MWQQFAEGYLTITMMISFIFLLRVSTNCNCTYRVKIQDPSSGRTSLVKAEHFNLSPRANIPLQFRLGLKVTGLRRKVVSTLVSQAAGKGQSSKPWHKSYANGDESRVLICPFHLARQFANGIPEFSGLNQIYYTIKPTH